MVKVGKHVEVKKDIPEAYLKYLLYHNLPQCKDACSDLLFPENNVEHVEFPDERWKYDKCRLEFRHNIMSKSIAEVQVRKLNFSRS